MVRLFHTNQFVVATCFDSAKVGTFTSLPEHYAEWKTTAPYPKRMWRPTSAWRSCRRSSAWSRACCTRSDCSTLVRHVALFMQPEDRGLARVSETAMQIKQIWELLADHALRCD